MSLEINKSINEHRIGLDDAYDYFKSIIDNRNVAS
jgi:hypothetical protein